MKKEFEKVFKMIEKITVNISTFEESIKLALDGLKEKRKIIENLKS